MKRIYPAGGWLPLGAHLEFNRDDQGKDFVTNWKGAIQAPGDGFVVHNLSDRPFPNGFGPNYPVVFISTGRFANHYWYIGHTTSAVQAGQHFKFGDVLSHADQGFNFEGTNGGWVELGEAPGGFPGPSSTSHWFDGILTQPLIINVPDPPLHIGDKGWRVLGMTSDLRDCGYLSRPYWHFNRDVHGAVIAFKTHNKLPRPKPDGGIVDGHVSDTIKWHAQWCKKHHKKEV